MNLHLEGARINFGLFQTTSEIVQSLNSYHDINFGDKIFNHLGETLTILILSLQSLAAQGLFWC